MARAGVTKRHEDSGSGNACEPAFAVRGKCQAGANVITRQLGEVGKNRFLTHAARKVSKYIRGDGHALVTSPDFSQDY